jgi:hypothetical protein
MKKLRLDVERLTVDTFQAEGTAERVGMAPCADAATRPGVCDPFSLPPRCA